MADCEYLMPTGFGEAVFEEKKSRFIGRVWPVETEEAALAHIADMRKQHHDATHNVFAYILRAGQTRYSDDGEPQGTSGMPTLNVFQSEGLCNFCCVITRYYGGILLGAGGLVRAYSKTAKMALDAAGVTVMRHWDTMHISCPYALFERCKTLIASHTGLVQATDFAADIHMEILLPVEQTSSFCQQIQELSSGSIQPKRQATIFRGSRLR